jgi:hypothetical protein
MRVVSCAIVAFALGCSVAAHAEPMSTEARADHLFHSAEKKFDSGDYAGACADFSESLKLGPKLGTLLNLALCHETIGRLVTAWSEFSHAAAWATQNNQKDRHDFAIKHVLALEPRLPRIVLQLPADRAIDGLDLDGEPVPEQQWFLPLYLDAGEHRLAVTSPGKKRTTVAFRVSPAASDQFVMVPSPSEPATPPPAVTKDRAIPTLGYVGLGAFAVGMAVGTVFGVLAATADDRGAATTRAGVATVAFVAGAAAGAGGAWVIWSSRF